MVKEKFIRHILFFLAIVFSCFNSIAQKDLSFIVPLIKENQLLDRNILLVENQLKMKNYCEENDSITTALNEEDSSCSVLYGKELFTSNGKIVNERFLLIQTADIFRDAVKYNLSNPYKSREMILNVINNINKLINQISDIKSDFEKLWLMENYTYRLNIILDKYHSKIDDYKDVIERSFCSLKNLDRKKQVLNYEESCIAIVELSGKYFHEWLIINPSLPIKNYSEVSSIDYLTTSGGELNAEPKIAEEFYCDSVKYIWGRITTEYLDIVNHFEIFPDRNQNLIMYSYTSTFSEKEAEVTVWLSWDDRVEAILKGKNIFKTKLDNLQPDKESLFLLPLKFRENNLLIKISKTDSDWKSSFRLSEIKVRNNKNKYRTIG